ncbi:leucyl aminopeptidase [Candidatus Uhrbacteria bacterium]|nr:leucyl aminopeptidase [Candidatus Uhrbacteria bacterium]
MQIKLTTGKPKSDSLIIPLYMGEMRLPGWLSAVDKKLITRLFKTKEFKGERGETVLDMSAGTTTKLLLLGLGDPAQLTLDGFLKAVGGAFLRLKRSHSREVTLWLPKKFLEKLDAEHLGQSVAEAAVLSGYSFLQYKTQEKNPPQVKRVFVLPEFKDLSEAQKKGKSLKDGLRIGESIAQSVNLTRDYGNSPSNHATPTRLAEYAKEIAKEFPNLKLTVLGRKEIEKEKMGGLLGVASGSAQEPKFIVLEYWGAGAPKETSHKKGKPEPKVIGKPIVVIGKGITFDTGGISIKPRQNLDEMKFDMAGAAAVLGILRSVASLKLPLNVVGLIPATENMPSGSAYKPGDILTMMDGSTVEVMDTDAEGRIVLADALVYARKYNPELTVDLATLTGACVVALGDLMAGLFTQDTKLNDELVHASTHTGDLVWPMPLSDEYTEKMKSPIADIRNLANTPYGGAITGAIFLKHFVKDFRWAHLDIAGTAWATGGNAFMEPGATGAGVRLMVQFLRERVRADKPQLDKVQADKNK